MSKSDIIKIENEQDNLARYEKLLLRRDTVRKEAEQYLIKYFHEFGDLMVKSFELKIECIRKKKTIAYCQQQINHGKKVDGDQLDRFINREMAAYYADLDMMIQHNKAVKESKSISEYDVYKVKKLYHALAKLIHPDLHPDLASDNKIAEYWQRIAIAYEHNMLEDLEELDFLVRKYLDARGYSETETLIPDLPKKIEKVEREIERITSTEPYLYRLLLQDETAVDNKKIELKDEIDSYRNYSKQLDEILGQFQIERSFS